MNTRINIPSGEWNHNTLVTWWYRSRDIMRDTVREHHTLDKHTMRRSEDQNDGLGGGTESTGTWSLQRRRKSTNRSTGKAWNQNQQRGRGKLHKTLLKDIIDVIIQYKERHGLSLQRMWRGTQTRTTAEHGAWKERMLTRQCKKLITDADDFYL